MYKVKNLTKQQRKVRDKFTGRDVIIEPGKTFLMRKAPNIDSNIFRVENIEENTLKKVEEKKTKLKEDDEKWPQKQ